MHYRRSLWWLERYTAVLWLLCVLSCTRHYEAKKIHAKVPQVSCASREEYLDNGSRRESGSSQTGETDMRLFLQKDPSRHHSSFFASALERAPYLQRPSSSSITICWRTWNLSSTRLLVWKARATSAVDDQYSDCNARLYTLGDTTHAHAVHIERLEPATAYFYGKSPLVEINLA